MASDGQQGRTLYIGRCEVMFCVLAASETVHSSAYGREIAVCEECYEHRTSEGNNAAGTKGEELWEFFREHS